MKLLVKLIFFGALALLVASVAALWLAFDTTPLLLPGKAVSTVDVERAKRLLERHDPRPVASLEEALGWDAWARREAEQRLAARPLSRACRRGSSAARGSAGSAPARAAPVAAAA